MAVEVAKLNLQQQGRGEGQGMQRAAVEAAQQETGSWQPAFAGGWGVHAPRGAGWRGQQRQWREVEVAELDHCKFADNSRR